MNVGRDQQDARNFFSQSFYGLKETVTFKNLWKFAFFYFILFYNKQKKMFFVKKSKILE